MKTTLSLMEILQEQYGYDSTMTIDEIPKEYFVTPPTRSTNMLYDGFKDGGLKSPKLVPITDRSLLKTMLKASRKKNKDTIKDLSKVWGLTIGRYLLLCIEYDVPGMAIKRMVLLTKAGLKKIAEANAAYKLAAQIRDYLSRNKR